MQPFMICFYIIFPLLDHCVYYLTYPYIFFSSYRSFTFNEQLCSLQIEKYCHSNCVNERFHDYYILNWNHFLQFFFWSDHFIIISEHSVCVVEVLIVIQEYKNKYNLPIPTQIILIKMLQPSRSIFLRN